MIKSLTIVSFIVLCVLNVEGQGNFYDIATIQKIEITFPQQNWDYMLDTAKAGKEGFVLASSVKVNNVYFDSVGVKYKGNSSYNSTSEKNPLHIELNTYKNHDYQGFKDIKLSNGYGDPSMIREVLAYNILQNYMPCPQSNFAQLYINGEYRGLYSNSESINKTFCADHFYSGTGTFIKANPKLSPSPSVKSSLKFLNGDSSAYFNYYEMKSDYGWKNLQALCDTITNKPGNLSSILNVDRTIWMLAFNNLLVNLDSYNGAFGQNYYLYKDKTGRFNPIIWDLNMCFGGFPFAGNATSLGSLSITGQQNFPVNHHANDPYWPLIKAINSNATYYKMYIAHLKTIYSEFFTNALYLQKYLSYKSIIDTAVLSDSKKFYSYSDFQNALTSHISIGTYSVPGIQLLMSARVSYLFSTSDFTNIAPTITNVATGQPVLNQPVYIKATITNANTVYLNYRFSSSDIFQRVTMMDDGLHNDGSANDNIFGADFTLSGNNAQYYIYAENNTSGTFSPPRAEYEFHNIDIFPQPQLGEIVINEFLADNKSDVANEFHIKEDWIELYNTSDKALSLANVHLSDESDKKAKYTFPATTVIQPKELLIVWADEFVGGTQLHAGFKLDEDGENLILSNGLTKIYDRVIFGAQEEDRSMARCPDGAGPFSPDKLPSYKLLNCLVGIEDLENGANFLKIYPNPASEQFTVKTNSGKKQILKIFDLMGNIKLDTFIDGTTQINVSEWAAGIYFVSSGNKTEKIIVHKYEN